MLKQHALLHRGQRINPGDLLPSLPEEVHDRPEFLYAPFILTEIRRGEHRFLLPVQIIPDHHQLLQDSLCKASGLLPVIHRRIVLERHGKCSVRDQTVDGKIRTEIVILRPVRTGINVPYHMEQGTIRLRVHLAKVVKAHHRAALCVKSDRLFSVQHAQYVVADTLVRNSVQRLLHLNKIMSGVPGQSFNHHGINRRNPADRSVNRKSLPDIFTAMPLELNGYFFGSEHLSEAVCNGTQHRVIDIRSEAALIRVKEASKLLFGQL